jgi:hypothetical protein
MSAKESLYISIADWQEKIATFSVNSLKQSFLGKTVPKFRMQKCVGSVLPSLQSFPKPTTLNF